LSQSTNDRRFTALYDQYYDRVYGYVVARGGGPAVDDIVVDTFMVAWRRLAEVPGQPLPWLIGVARNVLRERYRADVRARAVREQLLRWAVVREHTVPDVADQVVERAAVLRALAGLDEQDREVLTLGAWHDLSPAAAATALGCTRATYFVRLHRARRRLEQALGEVEEQRQARPSTVFVASGEMNR
jgi:RNA polymerase sigma-70 factor (ECF subfamily)